MTIFKYSLKECNGIETFLDSNLVSTTSKIVVIFTLNLLKVVMFESKMQ